MDLLRFSTAGSVDDGKSTLIGRLLFDSKGVFEDQLEAVVRSGLNRSSGAIDLSLLTDGLRAEREQGITIDVAYRYFATPKRKFIIADTPGHEQYTRNMATGSSTADLSIVLIDARHGALVQSRRHTYIASMLRIPHLVVAINKMDLVAYSQERYEEIYRDFSAFVAPLGFADVTFIPLSALNGDNVVTFTDAMPWYQGPSLLEHLENVDVSAEIHQSPFRFPVQFVIRPNLDFRGFAGQISAGVVRVGDEVMALPAGTRSKIKRIHTLDGDLQVAAAPQSVTLLLEDEIDISRGDMLVHPAQMPWIRREFDARVVWMDTAPLDLSRPYLLKHTTRTVRARVTQLHFRIGVNNLAHEPTDGQNLNEITQMRISCAQPLYLDAYSGSRRTGSFILIDPLTNSTVAAGMLVDSQEGGDTSLATLHHVDRNARETAQNHRAAVICLTAADRDARKSFSRILETRLFHRNVNAFVVDDSSIAELNLHADPSEGLRRLAELLRVLLHAGLLVIVDIPLNHSEIQKLRDQFASGDFAQLDLRGDALPPRDFEAPILPEGILSLVAPDADAAVAQALHWMAEQGLFGAPRVVSPGAGI